MHAGSGRAQGARLLRAPRLQVAFEETGIFQALRFQDAQRIAQTATDAFVNGEVDRVMLIYNEFKSVMTQHVVVNQLLPIPAQRWMEATSAVTTTGSADG